jgi:hypothetical protein
MARISLSPGTTSRSIRIVIGTGQGAEVMDFEQGDDDAEAEKLCLGMDLLRWTEEERRCLLHEQQLRLCDDAS